MLTEKFTLPYPPLQVRAGILVADGFGITLRVLYGKLRVEDGIGPHRRSIAVDRAGSGLERVVLLGKTGTLSLESLAWLRAIGAGLIQLSGDGDVLTHSVPYGYDGHPIRRAQAMAIATGLDVELARHLIAQKTAGQRANLVRLRVTDLRSFDAMREALGRADSIADVRLYEAKAAAIYWNAWSNVPIRLPGRDLAKVPARWARYDARASILTGAPRAATNPVNALLNFTYSLLETESRIALLSVGLDPTLGVLHADQRNRDSFALDAMEPIRPAVDSFVLDLLDERVLTARDFTELPNGVCRVRAPLTHELALTLPQWRLLLAPIVADLAKRFRAALLDRRAATVETRAAVSRATRALPRSVPGTPEIPRTKTSRRPGSKLPVPTSVPSPLRETPHKASRARPYAAKAWGAPRPEPLALVPAGCATCGAPVVKRRRRYCEACLPQARRERGLRAIVEARKALAAQSLAANDPRNRAETRRKRAYAVSEAQRRNHEWKRESSGARHDRAWFEREVAPQLASYTLSALAARTGLSLTACSRIRAGKQVPHQRHWRALLGLVSDCS